MSIDNRTELNDCDSATGWSGDGSTPAVNTTVGQRYQGTGSIESQHTNADEHMSTTEDSLNTGTFSIDMSDVTLYLLLKDNLVDTLANGGVQFVIGDGTDKIGYDIGGNDSVGLPLNPFFNCYKLDVSNRPAAFTVFSGVEANLTVTAITEVGIGTLHLAKAVGNVANIFVDYISYIANGSAALTINGGTVGTPETMADVQGDDVTNGWGLVSNPQGKQYNFFGPTEWGDGATSDSYFQADDEQWFFVGGVVGAGNFDFGLVANATGTNSFVINNTVAVNLDVRAAFDFNITNFDIIKLTNMTFTDFGVISFPTVDAGNKFANACTFNNCDQVVISTMDIDGATFNGTTDANGAVIITSDSSNFTNPTFNSDGAGHAIYITATGTYSFDGHTYSGFGADGTTDAVVYNNSGGSVTINVVGAGDVPTVRNGAGASTTVNANVNVTFDKLKDNTEVRVFLAGTQTEIAGVENATTGTTDNRSFTFSYAAATSVDYQIINKQYVIIRVEGYTIPSNDITIDIAQRLDLNY
jgi:hypothetical protein